MSKKNSKAQANKNSRAPAPKVKEPTGKAPALSSRSAAGATTGTTAELHQTVTDRAASLTTNHGLVISDNQNSLKAGERGPTLIEDFILREKITHFDHERIPERIVHARGSGAHGYFQAYKSQADITRAGFLQDPKKKTEVFARFSTVAGGAGSVDTPRDVRGFAVKFYTDEGNYDLVGNNIPVFFIQDAIKFPDLIHAVKMEPDRGFPQAASAHATFWDFISLTPESLHMIMWAMSDRTLPRSLRMIEGFGVHTFRVVNAKGEWNFVKFHWRPLLGTAATLWDEAVKIAGADPDFHRRDLWDAIDKGDFPEWELGLQVFSQAQADELDFDPLDPTKLIPEEIIPLRMVGKMTLNRNVDNFFAETEQVAFCPSHVVPGIDFSDDPLLQGRLFSYLDTQLSRLGGPNFHQIPINAPRCPFANMQRDGLRQMNVPKGRVAYEPNTLDRGAPRENTQLGFRSLPQEVNGEKVRRRAATFADHYSQARLFFRSMSDVEQMHMISALAFELAKVEVLPIRARVLAHLQFIDDALFNGVRDALGFDGKLPAITPAVAPRDLADSPSLSMVKKAKPILTGRKIGVLTADGFDAKLLDAIRAAAQKLGARVEVVAPKVGGAMDKAGKKHPADHSLSGAPSVVFDAVAILTGADSAPLAKEAAAVNWLRDAHGHLKAIALSAGTQALVSKASIDKDAAVHSLDSREGLAQFMNSAKAGRYWPREPTLRSPG